MGCREDILLAARALVARTGRETSGVADVIREMERRGTTYTESTIRTHVTSRMCGQAPKHHWPTYDDLERIDRNTYRLKRS